MRRQANNSVYIYSLNLPIMHDQGLHSGKLEIFLENTN